MTAAPRRSADRRTRLTVSMLALIAAVILGLTAALHWGALGWIAAGAFLLAAVVALVRHHSRHH